MLKISNFYISLFIHFSIDPKIISVRFNTICYKKQSYFSYDQNVYSNFIHTVTLISDAINVNMKDSKTSEERLCFLVFYYVY
jgi:hypothetical protein